MTKRFEQSLAKEAIEKVYKVSKMRWTSVATREMQMEKQKEILPYLVRITKWKTMPTPSVREDGEKQKVTRSCLGVEIDLSAL